MLLEATLFPTSWGAKSGHSMCFSRGGRAGLEEHFLRVSFLLQFPLSPLPGREEAGKAGNVRDLRAVADQAGAGVLQLPEPPGEDEQESNPRALHELRIPASDEVHHR